VHEPGPHHHDVHPLASQFVAQCLGKPVEASLGGAVHRIRRSHSLARNTAEHDDAAVTLAPHLVSQRHQRSDRAGEVHGRHRHRCVEIARCGGAVAEHCERNHR